MILCTAATVTAADQSAAPEQDDADLHAVLQIGSKISWAVGDRGTAWRSGDGGQSWSFVTLPERAACRSVCFLTARVGWIAAESTQPGQRSGVLLATRDGGAHWQRSEIPLSNVCHVQFFDLAHGVVVGAGTDEFLSGLIETDDGGANWRSLPGPASRDWRCAAFLGTSAVVAGSGTRVANFDGQAILEPIGHIPGRRTWHGAAQSGEGIAWLVGDGAAVLTRPNGRSAWATPATPLPSGLGDSVDFGGIAAVGDRAWIVGTPGSIIWHTPDGGRNWQRQTTGQPIPLHAITMNEAGHGISVGALGVIVVTTDGGRHWTIRRGQGRRLATLLIHGATRSIPLGLVARDSGEAGYRSRGYLAVRSNDLQQTLDMSRALKQLGAQGLDHGWRLSTRTPELERNEMELLRTWQSQTEGRLPELLTGRFTGLIRTWRPSVVVVDAADPDNHVNGLIRTAVATAIDDAADSTRWAVASALTGLPAWTSRRAFESLPAGQSGDVHVRPFEYLFRQKGPVAAVVARAVLSLPEAERRAWRGDRLKRFLGEGRADAKGVCAGLGLARGSHARRGPGRWQPSDSSRLQAVAAQNRAIGAFLQLSETGGRSSESLLAELRPMLSRMTDRQAGWTIWTLAERFRLNRQSALSLRLLRQLLREFPGHEANTQALERLLKEAASKEKRWQRLKLSTKSIRVVGSAPTGRGKPSQPSPTRTSRPINIPPKATRPVDQQARDSAAEMQQAVSWASQLQRRDPARYRSASIQLALASLLRSRGSPALADAIYRRVSKLPGPWQSAAKQESWLSTPGILPPAHVAACKLSARRPTLDALLSETCWQRTSELPLDPGPSRRLQPDHSFAMVAADSEHLYLSASLFRRYRTGERTVARASRRFDETQSGIDRVTFFIDTDRDYTLGYQLTVDHRGLVSERCGADHSWNPRCFVAVAGDQQSWRLELAIPWTELASSQPRAGQHWGLRIVRTIPSHGWETWGAVANTAGEPLAGAGLLSFVDGSPARSSR